MRQVGHLELEIDFLGLGQHGDGGRGGMDASLGLGGGHALDTVHADLVAHLAEDGLTGQAEDDFLQAAQIGLAGVHGLHFAADCAFRKAAVHAIEVGRKERRLGAAGAGADFHDGVAVLAGFGWQAGRSAGSFSELGQALFQIGKFGGGAVSADLGVVAGGKDTVSVDLAAWVLQKSCQTAKKLLQPAVLAQELVGRAPRYQKRAAADLALEFFEADRCFFSIRVLE